MEWKAINKIKELTQLFDFIGKAKRLPETDGFYLFCLSLVSDLTTNFLGIISLHYSPNRVPLLRTDSSTR